MTQAAGAEPAPAKEAPARWGYRVITEPQLIREAGIVLEKDKTLTADQELNNQQLALRKFGDGGWELVSVVRIDKHDVMKTIYHVYYLKKPKPHDAPAVEIPKPEPPKK